MLFFLHLQIHVQRRRRFISICKVEKMIARYIKNIIITQLRHQYRTILKLSWRESRLNHNCPQDRYTNPHNMIYGSIFVNQERAAVKWTKTLRCSADRQKLHSWVMGKREYGFLRIFWWCYWVRTLAGCVFLEWIVTFDYFLAGLLLLEGDLTCSDKKGPKSK